MKDEEPPPGSRREDNIPRARFATPGINIDDNRNDDVYYNSDNIGARINDNPHNSHNNGNNISNNNNTQTN